MGVGRRFCKNDPRRKGCPEREEEAKGGQNGPEPEEGLIAQINTRWYEKDGELKCKHQNEEFVFDSESNMSGKPLALLSGIKMVRLADGSIRELGQKEENGIEFINIPERIIGTRDLKKCDVLRWVNEYDVDQQMEDIVRQQIRKTQGQSSSREAIVNIRMIVGS